MTRYTLKSGAAYVCGLSRNKQNGLTISHDEPSRRHIYESYDAARFAANEIESRFAYRRLTLRGTNKLFLAHVRVVAI